MELLVPEENDDRSIRTGNNPSSVALSTSGSSTTTSSTGSTASSEEDDRTFLDILPDDLQENLRDGYVCVLN